jgi:hypothetical protein
MKAMDPLNLSEDMNPPEAKLFILMEYFPKFVASWKGLRADFTKPSQYDMSMARLAVQAGFDNHEIAALLIAHKRKQGWNLQLTSNYYAWVIAVARS